jgi:hypothetical protein
LDDVTVEPAGGFSTAYASRSADFLVRITLAPLDPAYGALQRAVADTHLWNELSTRVKWLVTAGWSQRHQGLNTIGADWAKT